LPLADGQHEIDFGPKISNLNISVTHDKDFGPKLDEAMDETNSQEQKVNVEDINTNIETSNVDTNNAVPDKDDTELEENLLTENTEMGVTINV